MGRPGYAGSHDERDEAPSPIEHATPDVELADAQLALGRPELAQSPSSQDEPFDEEAANGADGAGSGGLPPDRGGEGGAPDDGEGAAAGGGELAPAGGARVPDGRRSAVSRLINFLQGSWRELQRVQWPDRRQVMQATGVVLGFVIVAGVFLGVADLVATKAVNLILK